MYDDMTHTEYRHLSNMSGRFSWRIETITGDRHDYEDDVPLHIYCDVLDSIIREILSNSMKRNLEYYSAENAEDYRAMETASRLMEVFQKTIKFTDESKSFIEISEAFIGFLRIAIRQTNETLTYITDENVVWNLEDNVGDFRALIKVLTGDFISRAGMNRVFNDTQLAPVKA